MESEEQINVGDLVVLRQHERYRQSYKPGATMQIPVFTMENGRASPYSSVDDGQIATVVDITRIGETHPIMGRREVQMAEVMLPTGKRWWLIAERCCPA
jgi:hypothetical protein